jgi:hypothetical protein
MNPMPEYQPIEPLEPMNNNPSGKSRLSNHVYARAFEEDPSTGNNESTITLTPGDLTFNDWLQLHFDARELANSSTSGPLADPDHDGIPNLLEYAFASDPLCNSSKCEPKLRMVQDVDELTGSNETYLALCFKKNIAASDLTYTLQASSDLTNWTAIQGVVMDSIDNLDGTANIVLRDIVAVGDVPQRFLRLNVTQQ